MPLNALDTIGLIYLAWNKGGSLSHTWYSTRFLRAYTALAFP